MQAEQPGASTEQSLFWCLDAQDQCHPQLPGPDPSATLCFCPQPFPRHVLLSPALAQPGTEQGRLSHCSRCWMCPGRHKSWGQSLQSLLPAPGMSSCRLLLCPPGQPAGQAQLTLLCSSWRQFLPIFQSRICSAFPRQITSMLFLFDISFCLLILILLVYGSVLVQGFIENRKNNTFLTCRY